MVRVTRTIGTSIRVFLRFYILAWGDNLFIAMNLTVAKQWAVLALEE